MILLFRLYITVRGIIKIQILNKELLADYLLLGATFFFQEKLRFGFLMDSC
jgi:hypothetical protein